MPFGQRVLILPSGYENNEYKRTEGSVQEVASRFCWMKDSEESNTLEECVVSAQVSICLRAGESSLLWLPAARHR